MPRTLGDLLAETSTDDLMAVIRARPDFEDLRYRINRIAGPAALVPADPFAGLPPVGTRVRERRRNMTGVVTEPATMNDAACRPMLHLDIGLNFPSDVELVDQPANPVTWYAAAVLDAVHAHMTAGRIPPDVGSFAALHDHVDANMYLIRLVPFHAADCDCIPGPPGDQPYLHAETCASRADGGSADQHNELLNAVMDQVDALLFAEAETLRQPPVQQQVTALKDAMTAAAGRHALPTRFEVVQEPAQPGWPGRVIRDTVTGLTVPVPLYAYGAVRQVLAGLFPAGSDPARAAAAELSRRVRGADGTPLADEDIVSAVWAWLEGAGLDPCTGRDRCRGPVTPGAPSWCPGAREAGNLTWPLTRQ